MPLLLIRGTADRTVDVLIVLDDASYQRIHDRDPCCFNFNEMPTLHGVPLRLCGVVWADETDQAELVRLVRARDRDGAWNYATRGFKTLPGDVDHAPVSLGRVESDTVYPLTERARRLAEIAVGDYASPANLAPAVDSLLHAIGMIAINTKDPRTAIRQAAQTLGEMAEAMPAVLARETQ